MLAVEGPFDASWSLALVPRARGKPVRWGDAREPLDHWTNGLCRSAFDGSVNVRGRRCPVRKELERVGLDDVRTSGGLPIYIDMRKIGSSGGLYADVTVPLAERATRLLLDVLAEVHEGCEALLREPAVPSCARSARR